MAAAAAAAACSSTLPAPAPAASSSSHQQALFRLKVFRVRSLSPHRLPCPLQLRTSTRCSSSSSSSSYNGWADLAAGPDLPFALPLHPPQSHVLLPLLLLPIAALSLSRLPPIPLLAAAFAAGFAARHLAPASSQSHRLPAVLADLDAHVRALKNQLASSGADAGLLLDAVDRVRDAVVDAARLAGQGGNTTTTPADALAPVLGDVAKEVADYFVGWARETMRELSFSSPRKKPKDIKVAAAVVDAKSDPYVQVVDKGNKDAAASGAQAEQEDGDKLLDSPIHASTKPSIAKGNSLDSAAIGLGSARIALDMLPFDKDVNGLDDVGFGAQSTQEDDRLERLVFKHRYGRDGVRNDPFQGGSFATKSMESSLLERTLEIRDRSYRLKIERRGGESQVSEAQERPTDHFVGNTASFDSMDDESAATDSDGEEFSHKIKEAAEILRKARECMMAGADEETADALLYKSASILSTAVALRPTSLVAVGQLGNTYLLHGELKLKISRELRTLLTNSRAFLNGRERVSRYRKLDGRILSRENISSALVDVCEECESLLVVAGRSYRMAMSIDSGDVKALYNWGLALIFRAQLLADIGPEAAVDADRVYLAAIDKFDAMLSKSNTYAPEALYRWGTALQQRSHLRSRNNKEKIRLLEQAKSMFEDVLYVEADNKMVREALSSCVSELNYHGRWL